MEGVAVRRPLHLSSGFPFPLPIGPPAVHTRGMKPDLRLSSPVPPLVSPGGASEALAEGGNAVHSSKRPTQIAEEAPPQSHSPPAAVPRRVAFSFKEPSARVPEGFIGPIEAAGRPAIPRPFNRARNSQRRAIRAHALEATRKAKAAIVAAEGAEGDPPHSAHLGCFRAHLARKRLELVAPLLGVKEALADVARVESVVGWLRNQNGREDDAARQAACLESIFPWEAWCPACNRREWRIRGECGHRACALCHVKNYAKLARSVRERLGSTKWIGYCIWTIPHGIAGRHTVHRFTDNARKLAKAICDFFYPIIPAGVIYLHTSGKSDPWKAHPHYNVIWSSKGFNQKTGRVVKMPGPFLEVTKIKEMRDWIAYRAWKMGKAYVQGHYNYAKDEKHIRHKLRYVLRSQGDGNDLARHAHTHRFVRMTRPFGMIATGKAKNWAELSGWRDQESKAKELGLEGARGETCRGCYEPVRDMTPGPS